MFDRPCFTDEQLLKLDELIENTIVAKIDGIVERIQTEKQVLKEKTLFEKERLTQKELCELFELSKMTVIRWEKEGHITGERNGKNKFYSKKEVLHFIEFSRIASGRNYLKSTSLYYRELNNRED